MGSQKHVGVGYQEYMSLSDLLRHGKLNHSKLTN